MTDTKTQTTEFAWLIERGDSEISQPEYFVGTSPARHWGFAAWHSSPTIAVRFAREEDAGRVAMFINSHLPPSAECCRVCEHGWV